MSRSSWWFGVILFPVVPALSLLSGAASRTFVAASGSEADLNVGVGVASFILGALSFWGALLVGVIVLVCLLGDVRALGRAPEWSPSIAWPLVGIVHLAGVVLPAAFALSVPLLSYYLYGRHERTSTGGDGRALARDVPRSVGTTTSMGVRPTGDPLPGCVPAPIRIVAPSPSYGGDDADRNAPDGERNDGDLRNSDEGS